MMLVDSYGADNSIMSILLLLLNISFAVKCFYGPLFVFMDHCLFLWTTVCFSFLILSCYLSFNSRLHQNVNDKYLSDICCVFNFN
jgi:hypothetical protein